ncbi:hypothetical protein D3C86_1833480 [compost metagenome]
MFYLFLGCIILIHFIFGQYKGFPFDLALVKAQVEQRNAAHIHIINWPAGIQQGFFFIEPQVFSYQPLYQRAV